MPKIDVYSVDGNKVKELTLNEKVFGIEPNENVVHEVVLNYLANQRQGTQNTKTRAEVSGGGKKPWRQKGTGRARQGSIRAPQWIKGGIALGPKPRTYTYNINKKEKDLAVKSVLSAKVADKDLIVVDKLQLKEIKTAEIAKTLNNLKAEGKTLIILEAGNVNVQKSVRNIEDAKALTVNMLNIYDMLKATKVVITEDAVKKLEEVYA
jgi:large subunit ribosomal protein L4